MRLKFLILLTLCLSQAVLHGTLRAGDDKPAYLVRYLFSFPEEKIKELPLLQPQALSFDPDGNLYILDTGNNRIVKFDSRGRVLGSIGGFGWEKEEFDRPLDITATTGLDVFVADYNNERIERYDKDLNYISSFYTDPNLEPELQFGFPSGVAISGQGELFICDNENNRVLKLDLTGQPVLSFGDFNWGEGQLERPAKIELGPDNRVFVSDRKANQIVVFDYFGNYVARFGQGQLHQPDGLCWSDSQLLFVADSGSHRVVLFD
ncbi:MAG: hypothetical protein D6743_00205, partial [Calditrichaeota bacterium]